VKLYMFLIYRLAMEDGKLEINLYSLFLTPVLEFVLFSSTERQYIKLCLDIVRANYYLRHVLILNTT
jgi:hypothetical protein